MLHKLSDIVHRYADVKVLVVGDPMQDIYHFGRADRISPEAPVPVFIEERQKGRPGGAANVACNLAALGCEVRSVFPVGGQITEKHRYMVGHHQLFRIDRDVRRAPTLDDIAKAVSLCDWADVVVLSDYAKGWLTDEMCQHIIQDAQLVIVDPKGSDWRKYDGAELICPNHLELSALHGFRIGQTVLEKRGAEGLRLHRFGRCRDYTATAKAVFDVTGAGDTVVSVVAATLGARGNIDQACELANLAAGIVVGKVGTIECSAQELLCALDSATAVSTACTPDTDSSSSRPEGIVTGSLSPLTLTSPCGL